MATPGPARQPSRSPPLERDGELAAIEAVLDASASGAGAKITIEGPSGIGKSRLLSEAAALARNGDMEALSAGGSEMERRYPFGLVSRLLETRLTRASPEEREALLRGHAKLAGPLTLDRNAEAGRMATADAFELVHGLYWLVVNLAEIRPVALLVDDVQWADDLSLRFLIHLADHLVDLPVAMIVALRTGEPDADADLVLRMAAAGPTQSLIPGPLSLDAARDLLSLDGQVPRSDELVDAVWTATGGNPFLLHQVARVIREAPDRIARLDPADVTDLTPQSVARNVSVRLSRLGADALALAQACAVLGSGRLRLMARLANLDPDAALTAAERLCSAQVFVSTDPVAFEAPMIRAAVYDAFAPGERPRLHAIAAKLLHEAHTPDDLVAEHLLAANPSDEEWVTEALHAGARAAAAKGAPGPAARFLRRVLESTGLPTATRARVLIDLGIIEAASGDAMSLTRFEEALAIIDDPPEQERALYALGETLYRHGRYDEAAITFRRGAELFEDDDPDLVLRFVGAAACAGAFVMNSDDVARLHAAARTIEGRPPRTAAERAVLAVVALQRSMTSPRAQEAQALARAALGGGALLQDEPSNSMAVILAVIALVYAGDARSAQDEVDIVIADARERGTSLGIAEASFARAMVMRSRGSLNDLIADAQAAVEATRRGWHTFGPAPFAMLAEALVDRGQLDEAEQVLREGEGHLLGPLNSWYFYARGRLRLHRLDPKGAFPDLVASEDILQPYGVRNPSVPPWRALAGLAAHMNGDTAGGLNLINDQIAMSRDAGLKSPLGSALRARALVVRGPALFDDLDEAVAVLEDADAPLELARALVELGAAHRREGRRVESREPLRRALDLAYQCGAHAIENRCRDELVASGARPRRAALTGVESLTPSELRVAQLAAQGRTTRVIAETLFLSKHTIEWHLRQIYRKLEINSRGALAEQFAEVSRLPAER